MSSSMGRIIPYLMENKRCLKPPSRHDFSSSQNPPRKNLQTPKKSAEFPHVSCFDHLQPLFFWRISPPFRVTLVTSTSTTSTTSIRSPSRLRPALRPAVYAWRSWEKSPDAWHPEEWSGITMGIPIGSMYGIYTNIGGILMVNVTIYSIHGSYGNSWNKF